MRVQMYLRRIRPFYESEMVKVVMGIRRCGKSTLLRQIEEEIAANGVPDERIIRISFEDYRYRKLSEPDAFFEYVEERILSEDRYYLFFDEIQNVTDFELVII